MVQRRMEKMGLEMHGMFSFFLNVLYLQLDILQHSYVHHLHHQHHLDVQQLTEWVPCLNSIHLGKLFYSSFSLYLMLFLSLATGTGMTMNGHAYHPRHHVGQPWIPPVIVWLLHQCPLFFLPPSIPQPANIPILFFGTQHQQMRPEMWQLVCNDMRGLMVACWLVDTTFFMSRTCL